MARYRIKKKAGSIYGGLILRDASGANPVEYRVEDVVDLTQAQVTQFGAMLDFVPESAPVSIDPLVTPAVLQSDLQAGDVPVWDGFKWTAQPPGNTGSVSNVGGGGVWTADSSLGATQRAATALLMSQFDTDPASTDHTAALQAALNAAAALITGKKMSKVQIIMDSRQFYSIGGPVVAGAHGEWSQINLPFSQAATGVIELVGIPRGNTFSYMSAAGESGTVIRSTLTSAPAFAGNRGIASVIGGPASFCNPNGAGTFRGYPGFNMIQFATKDITIRQPTNPALAGIDCGWVAGFFAEGLLQFDTDQMASFPGGYAFDFSARTPCTGPQAVALILPFGNDWYGAFVENVSISGWAAGLVIGECARIKRITAFSLTGAILNIDGSAQSTLIDQINDYDNAYGIATMWPTQVTPFAPNTVAPHSQYPIAAGNPSMGMWAPLRILNWNMQRKSGWTGNQAAFNRVYDVMDPNCKLPIEGFFNGATGAPGNVWTILKALSIYGYGNSLTGGAPTQKLKCSTVGATIYAGGTSGIPAVPLSGTTIRNPTGRDAAVILTLNGATAVSAQVNAVAVPDINRIFVPSCGSLQLTYTGGPPTWNWQTL